MSHSDYLKAPAPATIDNQVGETTEQESACAMEIGRPTLWALSDFVKTALDLEEEGIADALATLPVPGLSFEELGASVSVKPDAASSHVAIAGCPGEPGPR